MAAVDDIQVALPPWEWIGAEHPTLRLGGQSNRGAYFQAMYDGGTPSSLVDEVAVLHCRGWRLPDDAYWDQVIDTPGPLAIVWNGNQANVYFMMSGTPVTVLGRRQSLPDEPYPPLIPYRMVAAMWQESLSELDAVIRKRGDAGSTLVVGTPPPKSEDEIRAGLRAGGEGHFNDVLINYNLTPDTAPVTAVATRVAAWESLQEGMARIATNAGATFVPVLDSVRLADGTLAPEFSERDATHANAAYGRLMWNELLAHRRGDR